MRADDWIIDYLIKNGVTDIFGIPGVVVMDFLYAADKRTPKITPHLNYHEQGAAFAANGYAQVSNRLGVAYATRGPGFTNMITAIADAYYDSIPVLFLTAHSSLNLNTKMRAMNNQEIDTVSLVKNVTKRAVRIDNIEELQREVAISVEVAMKGRKGPVFLDIYNELFSKEVHAKYTLYGSDITKDDSIECVKAIVSGINKAKRPVILIGNGIREKSAIDCLIKISNTFNIPILSSRIGQDIIPNISHYYGFIGSRATRYSNFILGKADLIIAMGNRMSFPIQSKSFWPIVERTHIIRVDLDDSEFERNIPNSVTFNCDAALILKKLVNFDLEYENVDSWINVCEKLKTTLKEWDKNQVIEMIMEIMSAVDKDTSFICDVGNHSFWVTSAYAYSDIQNRILYSGAFGTLGCALPKAIGTYYATKKQVICFTGDQGVQFNIQELQYISHYKLPITIVILNNSSSGMIMEREVAKHGNYLLHTTPNDGYSYPEFEKIADCYGLNYSQIDLINKPIARVKQINEGPSIIEILVDRNIPLEPNLPIGNRCEELAPMIPRELFEKLDEL